jgi:hypothetical protein
LPDKKTGTRQEKCENAFNFFYIACGGRSGVCLCFRSEVGQNANRCGEWEALVVFRFHFPAKRAGAQHGGVGFFQLGEK